MRNPLLESTEVWLGFAQIDPNAETFAEIYRNVGIPSKRLRIWGDASKARRICDDPSNRVPHFSHFQQISLGLCLVRHG